MNHFSFILAIALGVSASLNVALILAQEDMTEQSSVDLPRTVQASGTITAFSPEKQTLQFRIIRNGTPVDLKVYWTDETQWYKRQVFQKDGVVYHMVESKGNESEVQRGMGVTIALTWWRADSSGIWAKKIWYGDLPQL